METLAYITYNDINQLSPFKGTYTHVALIVYCYMPRAVMLHA